MQKIKREFTPTLSSWEDSNRWKIRQFINSLRNKPAWDPTTCGRFTDFVIEALEDDLYKKEIGVSTIRELSLKFKINESNQVNI